MSGARVVQFIHPGEEHGADQWHGSWGWKNWNVTAKHKRKFLLADGSWTWDPRKSPTVGRFTFWGEWEPQSQVRKMPTTAEAHPAYLHVAQLNLDVLTDLSTHTQISCNGNALEGCGEANTPQNTDPLVFGPRFLYVLCQQPSEKTLRSLNPGDIILFGSKKRKTAAFVLDTVLVVGVHTPIRRGGVLPDWESDLHRRITMDLIENQIPGCGLRLYGGQAWSSEEPFSFVLVGPPNLGQLGFRGLKSIQLDR